MRWGWQRCLSVVRSRFEVLGPIEMFRMDDVRIFRKIDWEAIIEGWLCFFWCPIRVF